MENCDRRATKSEGKRAGLLFTTSKARNSNSLVSLNLEGKRDNPSENF